MGIGGATCGIAATMDDAMAAALESEESYESDKVSIM